MQEIQILKRYVLKDGKREGLLLHLNMTLVKGLGNLNNPER